MQDEEEYKPGADAPGSSEYDFNGDEFAGEYTVDESAANGSHGGLIDRVKSMAGELMHSRRMMMIAGSVFAVLVIYIILLMTDDDKRPPETTLPTTATLQQPQQPVARPQNDALGDVANQVNEQFKQYNQAITQNKVNIDALAKQVNAVSQTVVQMRSTVESMNKTVSDLDASVKQLTAKPKVKTPTRLVLYRIKALVPGRAWLTSSTGMPTTVRQGDILPGYGRIMLIDPHQGVVATSSGRVIQYGIDDR